MTFQEFEHWAFLSLMTGGIIIMWKAYVSLNDLNLKIAVVIERLDSHEKRITHIEKRRS